MKKNVIIIALIFAIPLMAYMLLTASNSTTAQTTETGKPQVIKFTSAMCLDCQTMNKIFKEIFPKYEGKIVLTEIQVQDQNSFNQDQIKKYNVTLVPTIILLNSQGAQVKRIEGAVSKEEMELQLIGLQEEMLELHKKKTKGLLDAKEYATKGQKLAEEIKIKRKKLEELESESILSQVMEERINDINKLIDGGILLDTFDPLVFRSMVDSVVVNERTKLTFKFKVGIQKTIVTTVK